MKIKEKPEDFVVEELIDLEESPGKYLYVKVKKRDLNTLDIVRLLSRNLHIPRKNISFAGTKDKRAVTTQHFSLLDVQPEAVEKLSLKDVQLTPLHFGKKPISLGSLYGNHFRIKLPLKIEKGCDFLVNYFGEQRFSTNNVEIGKALILKRYLHATKLLKNDIVDAHLFKRPNDFIGALRRLDKKLISLLINSYQSYLWNKVVALYLDERYDTINFENYMFVKERKQNVEIPLLAFDTEFQDPLLEKFYKGVMEEEEIILRDFVLRSFPDAMPVSTPRAVFVDVKDFKIEEEWISFILPKGSYATVLIKQLESFL